MAGIYRVRVKDGDYGYHDGEYGNHDYVANYDNFALALKDFIEWTEEDELADSKVTLTFRPEKGDKA
jgi:hypothetical protein